VEEEVERPRQVDVVGDVVLHEHEVPPGQVLDVSEVAGDEVVHPHHGEAAVEKQLAEVRAEEPGRAGDEGPGHQ